MSRAQHIDNVLDMHQQSVHIRMKTWAQLTPKKKGRKKKKKKME